MKRGRNTTVHFVPKSPIKISACLAEHFHLKAEAIAELLALGAIYCNKQRILEDKLVAKTDSLQIHLQPKRYPSHEIDWKTVVVSEEANFWLIDKPAGIPVHATNDNLIENLQHALEKNSGQKAYITQRLDTPVSGLMIVAKNEKFQKIFNELLAEGKVRKRYCGLVEKAPALGKHTHFMEPSERMPRQVSAVFKPRWLKCELSVHKIESTTVLGGRENFALEIELHTGRTHQIRVQLAALGCPLLGDKLYGGKRLSLIPRTHIALCATSIAWSGDGKKYDFKLSPDFAERFSR